MYALRRLSRPVDGSVQSECVVPKHPHLWALILSPVVIALAATAVPLVSLPRATAASSTTQITTAFSSAGCGGGACGVFFVGHLNLSFVAESVVIANHADGTGNITVNDAMEIKVTHQDSSTATFYHDFSNGCSGHITPSPPIDVTSLFEPGNNQIQVTLSDLCAPGYGPSELWLVQTDLDSDFDGYTDSQEVLLGTSPTTYCAIMRADVDGDGKVTILDLSLVAADFLQAVPPAPQRLDQGPPPFDDQINVLDLSKMAAQFGKSVTACP